MSLTRRVLNRVAQTALTKALPHEARPTVRIYYLDRLEDKSGISGSGIVACGVIFPNGWCCQLWLTEHNTITFFTSIDEVKAVHGHDGATRILIQDVDAIAETELE